MTLRWKSPTNILVESSIFTPSSSSHARRPRRACILFEETPTWICATRAWPAEIRHARLTRGDSPRFAFAPTPLFRSNEAARRHSIQGVGAVVSKVKDDANMRIEFDTIKLKRFNIHRLKRNIFVRIYIMTVVVLINKTLFLYRVFKKYRTPSPLILEWINYLNKNNDPKVDCGFSTRILMEILNLTLDAWQHSSELFTIVLP